MFAAEQGAHIVKTYYCDNFEKVVQSCPVPIIVAGGKKIPERDALQLTFNAIKSGAVGVDMGRNIWQSEHPVSMIKAVRAIVHSNQNVDQAFKLYKKLVSEESKSKKRKPAKTNQTDRIKTSQTLPLKTNQTDRIKTSQTLPLKTNQTDRIKTNQTLLKNSSYPSIFDK